MNPHWLFALEPILPHLWSDGIFVCNVCCQQVGKYMAESATNGPTSASRDELY